MLIRYARCADKGRFRPAANNRISENFPNRDEREVFDGFYAFVEAANKHRNGIFYAYNKLHHSFRELFKLRGQAFLEAGNNAGPRKASGTQAEKDASASYSNDDQYRVKLITTMLDLMTKKDTTTLDPRTEGVVRDVVKPWLKSTSLNSTSPKDCFLRISLPASRTL
ncbi:hypothetical protein SPFM12_00255 [Salmonella phage SPFM12]|nr:hypothetical protein SPFM12_00255 [Salmonella phage SPFM12]